MSQFIIDDSIPDKESYLVPCELPPLYGHPCHCDYLELMFPKEINVKSEIQDMDYVVRQEDESRIIIPVRLISGDKKYQTKAIVDTGSQIGAFSPKIIEKLSLAPCGTIEISGSTGSKELRNLYKCDVAINNTDTFYEVNFTCSDIFRKTEAELLIGMDILMHVDFSFSTVDGKGFFYINYPAKNKIMAPSDNVDIITSEEWAEKWVPEDILKN